MVGAIYNSGGNPYLVFCYLAPMVLLPALALQFLVDHKRGMAAVGRVPGGATAAGAPREMAAASSSDKRVPV